jgi:aryl-alcohol dehydrogenase-like predicted oxidoreductase
VVADDYLYRVIEALDVLASETGRSVPQLALNWLLRKPTIASIIIGARNEQQLRDNLGAPSFVLTPEQIAQLDAASELPPSYPAWHLREFQQRNPLPPTYVGPV